MRHLTFRQTVSATWAADATQRTDLERIGLLTRVDLLVEVTPSATLTAANQPDGLNRLIQNVRILGGGAVYVTLPGDDGCQAGSIIHYLNKIDGLGVGHPDGAIAAPTRTFTPMKFSFHFGSRPKVPGMPAVDNPYDLSAFIPAGDESQLTAEWVTSGNDVCDDSVTISSAVGRYTLHRVRGTPGEIQQEMRNQGVVLPANQHGQPWSGMVPAWSSSQFATAATTTDYDAETDAIPTGAFIRRATLLSQDATATRTLRAGDEVTETRIWSSVTNEVLYQQTSENLTGYLYGGDQLTANSGSLESGGTEKMGVDFNEAAPLGVYPIDFRNKTFWAESVHQYQVRKDYGWDMRGFNQNDIRLGHIITTRAAGDDRLILWEKTIPTNVDLAVAAK